MGYILKVVVICENTNLPTNKMLNYSEVPWLDPNTYLTHKSIDT